MTQAEINRQLLAHIRKLYAEIEALKAVHDDASVAARVVARRAELRERLHKNEMAGIRRIRAEPALVCLCAHLMYVRDIPARRLYDNGIMSQSKVVGLAKWSASYALDFAELHGLAGLLKHGETGETDEARLAEIITDPEATAACLGLMRDNQLRRKEFPATVAIDGSSIDILP